MPESMSTGSVVPGAHGPHVGVSAASQPSGPTSPLISGKSANDYAFMTREMERDRKLYDADWQRRIKAEKALYATMLKSQKGMNQNISGIATDSKAFWARTSAEFNRTIRGMATSIKNEMSEVSKNLESSMDKMISLSMQRQKKADDALRAAVKQGDLYTYQLASYKAKNESNRLSHATTYKRKNLELQEASRAKTVYETKMSRGETLSPEDYRAYERLTGEIRDLEREMKKLNMVNTFLAKGITDVEQAMRAADIELDFAEKHFKSMEQRLSEWKVNSMEAANHTLTFANALHHLGEAFRVLYKDYALFTEQAYKMNGVIDLNNLSFATLAKNTISLEVSNAKLRLFAATAGISTEEFDQLNGKLFSTYTMMDKFGKLDNRKYELMGKELLSYSRQTGASLDETIGIHAKLRMQFGKTNSEALRSMRSIIAAQKETQFATSNAFGDFATFNDDFQKSIESVIDGYSGFKLDISGVTALFKDQVQVATKLGYTYQQSFDIAKKFTGLLTKKNSSYMSYHTGQIVLSQAEELFGGEQGLKALQNMNPEERGKYIEKVLGTGKGKASGFKTSDIQDLSNAVTNTMYGPAAIQAADMLEGSTPMIAAKLQQLDTMQQQGLGTGAAFKAIMGEQGGADAMREYQMMQDMLKNRGSKSYAQLGAELKASNDKNGEKQAPNTAPTLFDPANIWNHFKDFWDKSPLGQLGKFAAVLTGAVVLNTMALGANTLALIGNTGGKAAGVLGSIVRKIPGIGGILGPAKIPGGIAGEVESGVMKESGNLGKVAKVASKFGTPGKLIAGAALAAGGIWGLTKLWDHYANKSPQDQAKEQQADLDAQNLLGNTGDQVDEQKKTNEKLDKISDNLGKGGAGSGAGGGGIMSSIGTVAAGATGIAGGLAAYFGIKSLLSSGAEDAALAAKATEAATGAKAVEAAGDGAKVASATKAASKLTPFLEVLGPLASYWTTEGPDGRKLAAAVGAGIGGLGGLIGGGGLLSGALGIAGAYGGEKIGTSIYDNYLADRTLIKGNANMPSLAKPSTDFDANTVAGAVGPSTVGTGTTPGAVGPNGKPVSTTGVPSGVGTGSFTNVGRDGTAELTLKVKVANMHHAVRTVLRDDYNTQHPDSGMARTSWEPSIIGGAVPGT